MCEGGLPPGKRLDSCKEGSLKPWNPRLGSGDASTSGDAFSSPHLPGQRGEPPPRGPRRGPLGTEAEQTRTAQSRAVGISATRKGRGSSVPAGSGRRAYGQEPPQFFQVSGCPGSAPGVASSRVSHLLGKRQKNLFTETAETFCPALGSMSFSDAASVSSVTGKGTHRRGQGKDSWPSKSPLGSRAWLGWCPPRGDSPALRKDPQSRHRGGGESNMAMETEIGGTQPPALCLNALL
ncbi:uncharacterized protein LOC125167481 [Prionailurus viverrinus]|uniref:uncharacterized protein LOC125167481 n=1 Tax=Prionailurus viverrinus TaxID=61388 RepID=UPI001FF29D47|nr:uncharacterized protein LOC125167481 [Prionailurus viverrinus]